MKRQINYILMQTVLWGGWICEYIWFLKHQFQMRFDLWVFVAYLFLLPINLALLRTGLVLFVTSLSTTRTF